MAAMGHVSGVTNYPLDFSNRLPEVLDLSGTNKRTSEPKSFSRPTSPQMAAPSFPYRVHHEYPQNADVINQPHSSNAYPGVHCHTTYRERFPSNESLNNIYCPQAHSPTSLYSNDGQDPSSSPRNITPSRHSNDGKEASSSPRNNTPSRLSPNLPGCYAAPEQLSPLLLNAALQQHYHLQNNTTRKSESDTSDGEQQNKQQDKQPKIKYYPMMNTGREGKITRPFKAFPHDPMTLANGLSAVDSKSVEKFAEYRKQMFDQICALNGGSVTVTNPRMRRTITPSAGRTENGNSTGEPKDDAYAERRMKNNAAAKKSRDKRRIKEDEIAIRAAFLEKENLELKIELAAVRRQHSSCGMPSTSRF